MIDIVFSDSACGSLKMAQHYGRGEYLGGSVGVIITRHDGSEPTREEIEAAQKEAERRERLEWEKAVPLGGNAADVFGFSLALSIGGISEMQPGAGRQRVIRRLFSVHPCYDFDETIREIPQRVRETLDAIRVRIGQDEPLRLWCSNQPDDICGMYWFMAWIVTEEIQHGEVLLVQLPQWEEDESGNVVQKNGWGDVSPGEWHRYLHLSRAVPEAFIQGCANHWRCLQKDNAPGLSGRTG